MSQNSYLREFCAQLSQIVFLADFTVLRLISTVCTKMSQKLISPLVLCTSRINRVLNWFERFTAYKKIMSKNITKLISPWILCTNTTNQVLSWFDRFTAYYYCMSKNCHETHISASSVHKYQRSCFKLIWPFYLLLELYAQKCHKTHISASSLHRFQKSSS